MDMEELKALIDLLEKSSLKKLFLKKEGIEVLLEKDGSEYIPPKIEKTEPKSDFFTYVKSPMIGTFYFSPAPSEPPFVKIGDYVEENTVVCIIEAMKVMNEVKASQKGIVKEILVENAQPVEFGTKLLRIEPR